MTGLAVYRIALMLAGIVVGMLSFGSGFYFARNLSFYWRGWVMALGMMGAALAGALVLELW